MDSKPPLPSEVQDNDAYNDRIPTYEESIQTSSKQNPSSPNASSHPARPANLTQRLSQARTARIEALLTHHIEPILADSAAEGLHHTTLVLVPSSVEPLQPQTFVQDPSEAPPPSAAQDDSSSLTGFTSSPDSALRLVRLKGQQHSLDFWRQAAVVAELRRSLEARLVGEGLTLHSDGLAAPRLSGAGVPLDGDGVPVNRDGGSANRDGLPIARDDRTAAQGNAALSKRSGLLRRRNNRTSDVNNECDAPPARNTAAERAGMLAPGSVRVKAAVQEVSMRVVTEMGLYDSRTGPAVVVEVDIG